jgi:hypothetical protein
MITREFAALMDNVCTSFLEGELWHERSANECRKISFRGGGRWHEAEAYGDFENRLCIEKILRDRLNYAPNIDMNAAARAVTYTLTDIRGLQQHFEAWLKREEMFIQTLGEAVRQSALIDIEIYNKLCEMLKEVQTETMRVMLCGKRLEMAGWNTHDIGVCSMIIHKYYEEHPHCQEGNVNLG